MKIFGKQVSDGAVLVGGGLLAYFVIQGGKLAVSAVNAKYLNFSIKSFQLSPSGGTIVMSIINGSPSSYTLQSLTEDILVNGTRIATVSYMGQLVVMPNATTSLSLTITLDPAGLITEALTIGAGLIDQASSGNAPGTAQTITITATGSAQVDTIMLPVNATLDVIQA